MGQEYLFMKKIKVAIPLVKNSGWLGGYNYIVNLLEALEQIPKPKIEILIFTSKEIKNQLSTKFPKFKFIDISVFTAIGFLYGFTRFIGKYFGSYIFHELFLRFFGISVLAYSSPLSRMNLVATICWIPDFQHIYLEEFFSKNEICKRNKLFKKYIYNATVTLVSSNSAKNDLKKFSPLNIGNARVLKFVSCQSLMSKILSFSEIKQKYDLPNLYFHLPNQFWQHKNHKLVANSVAALNKRNIRVNIICTGKTYDYRDPKFFDEFLIFLKKLNVYDQFRILGVIPYEEMISLMYYSTAVINPSFFEGWSTTVEESKTLNKKILLSKIPVHIEQNPNKGRYFSSLSYIELADEMEKCLKNHSNEIVKPRDESLFTNNKIRISDFANNFEDIVLEAQNLKHQRSIFSFFY